MELARQSCAPVGRARPVLTRPIGQRGRWKGDRRKSRRDAARERARKSELREGGKRKRNTNYSAKFCALEIDARRPTGYSRPLLLSAESTLGPECRYRRHFRGKPWSDPGEAISSSTPGRKEKETYHREAIIAHPSVFLSYSTAIRRAEVERR